MKMHKELTQSLLRTQLHYSPETGQFTWLVQRGGAFPGAEAGAKNGQGYICIDVLGRQYRAHRLAWLYMTGTWPVGLVDHRDGRPSNNAWSNLREASHAQNQMNRSLAPCNKSGVKGVSWHSSNKTWVAQLTLHGKKHRAGAFRDIHEAEAAVKALRDRLHGEYANHGIAASTKGTT